MSEFSFDSLFIGQQTPRPVKKETPWAPEKPPIDLSSLATSDPISIPPKTLFPPGPYTTLSDDKIMIKVEGKYTGFKEIIEELNILRTRVTLLEREMARKEKEIVDLADKLKDFR